MAQPARDGALPYHHAPWPEPTDGSSRGADDITAGVQLQRAGKHHIAYYAGINVWCRAYSR
jgi:hypothetical protein